MIQYRICEQGFSKSWSLNGKRNINTELDIKKDQVGFELSLSLSDTNTHTPGPHPLSQENKQQKPMHAYSEVSPKVQWDLLPGKCAWYWSLSTCAFWNSEKQTRTFQFKSFIQIPPNATFNYFDNKYLA